MKTILKDNPDIQKAHDEYRVFAGSDEYREAYEAQLKLKRDIESQLETAREQGVEKGIEQGIEQGDLRRSLETARNMIKMGEPVEKVTLYTGLTAAELKKHRVV